MVRHQDSIEHTPAQEAFDELEKVRRVANCGCMSLGLVVYNRIIILRLHKLVKHLCLHCLRRSVTNTQA